MDLKKLRIGAFIPARGGSKRVPQKNIKRIGEHPLIAYTIDVAKKAGVFKDIVVSSDDIETLKISEYYGARVIHRPAEFAQDNSPDFSWIEHLLENSPIIDYFVILRPTNPFRTTDMILRALEYYRNGWWLKAIDLADQHPFKMWTQFGDDRLTEFIPIGSKYHALPSQSLPTIFMQNGSIEIRPAYDIEPFRIQGFLTTGFEGFDINNEKDWVYADYLYRQGIVRPLIARLPYGLTL